MSLLSNFPIFLIFKNLTSIFWCEFELNVTASTVDLLLLIPLNYFKTPQKFFWDLIYHKIITILFISPVEIFSVSLNKRKNLGGLKIIAIHLIARTMSALILILKNIQFLIYKKLWFFNLLIVFNRKHYILVTKLNNYMT